MEGWVGLKASPYVYCQSPVLFCRHALTTWLYYAGTLPLSNIAKLMMIYLTDVGGSHVIVHRLRIAFESFLSYRTTCYKVQGEKRHTFLQRRIRWSNSSFTFSPVSAEVSTYKASIFFASSFPLCSDTTHQHRSSWTRFNLIHRNDTYLSDTWRLFEPNQLYLLLGWLALSCPHWFLRAAWRTDLSDNYEQSPTTTTGSLLISLKLCSVSIA